MAIENPIYGIVIPIVLICVAKYIFRILKSSQGTIFPVLNYAKIIRNPYIYEAEKRNVILKQNFNSNKVPEDLDAIVVGSGIGGLCTAAILAKAGKKVLVLEQHDQAGGCCHTYIERGYEFDVGIHYVGDVNRLSLSKYLLDQISDAQIEWEDLDDSYDVVSIAYGKGNRRYPVVRNKWQEVLKEQFPGEHEAIDNFFKLIVRELKESTYTSIFLKALPLWVSKILISSGLIHWKSKLFSGKFKKSTLELVRELTSNKDLQTCFTYCWGDYGTQPSESHLLMQSLVLRHYLKGASYPVNGASEFAFNIIPVIERAGGKVLVRANVDQIMYNGSKVLGVKVKTKTGLHSILAPIIISDAGLYNTFQKLLPLEAIKKSYFNDMTSELKPAIAGMSVFVGLNASGDELKLKKQNMWAFTENYIDGKFNNYINMTVDEMMNAKTPMLFVSFPSVKDPNWAKHPGRKDKTTCTIITLASWDWYRKFEKQQQGNRGDDYDEIKKAVGDIMLNQAIELFPQIKHHIDYVEVGSPVTNAHYLAAPHGEMYGLDHDLQRFDAWTMAQLRPQTDISGLYLTGQDIFFCGFIPSLYSGALTASSILGHNLMMELISSHKEAKKLQKKSKMD